MNASLSETPDNLLKGIAFALFAFFLFAVMSAAAKILANTYGHHVAEIAFYRNLIFLIPLLAYMTARKNPALFKTKKPKGVAFRAIIGSISLITTYAAFAHLPMADTTVLLFASTLITPIIVHFALREHVGIYRWSAILVGMGGVLLMAAPTGSVSPLGVGFALAAATMHAMMYSVLRYLKTENSLTVTFYFILAGVVIPGIFFMPFVASPIATLQEGGLFLLL
ncbi:MAG: DMT family transporter, partial [Bdellovibrionales bacterium]